MEESDEHHPAAVSHHVGFLPRLKPCLLPTSSLSPKQTFQTLLNPIYSRKIEVRSDSGGDIDSGGLLNVVSEVSKIVP